MAPLGPNRLGVSSVLSYSSARMLVDEYCRGPGGDYVLRESSVDLLRYLKAQGIHVDYVPDLQRAVQGAYNGAQVAKGSTKQSSNEVTP